MATTIASILVHIFTMFLVAQLRKLLSLLITPIPNFFYPLLVP